MCALGRVVLPSGSLFLAGGLNVGAYMGAGICLGRYIYRTNQRGRLIDSV